MMLKWDQLEGKKIKDKGNGQDRYVVTNTIGKGGAGKVYLAKDTFQDDKLVAIKTADPNATMSNFEKRFKMEADILSKLNSPYIISFFDYFIQDGIQMIVMEYVEGIPLDKKLRKERRLSKEDSLKFTKQLLEALHEVHSHKVYHRDIKPDNIHITIDGNVKLLDFGIVQETVDQDLTRQGSVIGTVSYLAPEIIQNPYKKANPRTDIYSVGVMLYELLTGVKPFNADAGLVGADKNNNLARKIVLDPVVDPTDIDGTIPQEVSHFVMMLINKEPADRYQSAKDALLDINRVMNGEAIHALEGYYAGESKDFTMKKQIIILSAVAAAFLILFIVAIILFMTL